MNDQHDPVARLVAAAASDPPGSLRARTLARAAEAWPHPAPPDAWRRVWESRPLRLAWAVATLALAVANLALPTGPSRRHPVAATGVETERTAARELRDEVALPRLKPEYAATDVNPTRLAPRREPRRGPASPAKENPS